MKPIVVFTGAGVSAESGISTFRDSNGLWENYSIEKVATPEAWRENKELVQSFYNARRENIAKAQPNLAHTLIASLESSFDVTVITQNIDDLHERAGSSNVIHLHGNIRLAKSSGPRAEERYYPIIGNKLDVSTDLCEDGFPLRPHVVWFGEAVPMYEYVIPIIESAALFIVIGTSLNVYPAAGLIHYCNPKCKRFIIDPKADSLSVPSDFEIIPFNAVAGMETLIQSI